MKYIFGPVPSKRLGQSLGIDPIPSKVCNWNCIYCQLGRTRKLSQGKERKEYFPCQDIIKEFEETVANHRREEIDWVTFVGSGEPTLHSGIGFLIREIKRIGQYPTAIITNGALLYLPEVREDLLEADAVMPSLDAGTEKLYRHINRALPELTLERLIEGLTLFSKSYKGKFWLETMLIKGVNDSEEALTDLARAIEKIKPDQLHLNVPTRPPAESWIEPADEEGLARAESILGSVATIISPVSGVFSLEVDSNDLGEEILGIITRHPMSEEQIIESLANIPEEKIKMILDQLEVDGKARMVRRLNKNFWSTAEANYIEKGR